MELKYDIYMLNNAQGTGEKRQYIRIVQREMWLRCWQSFMTFWWKNSPWDAAFISQR